jgi:hypothetical protein
MTPPKPSKATVALYLRVDPEFKSAIAALAEDTGRSMGQTIEETMRPHLRRYLDAGKSKGGK